MSNDIPPLAFHWDGECMTPKLPRLADRHFVIGEQYTLVPHEERSANSHRHYFASLRECWLNLPENLAERFQDADALRKYCLIKAGFADQRSLVCASKAEAERVAAFIRSRDGFSIVTVSGATVVEFTARSQSARAMGKEEFQRSKTAVLETASAMIGVDVGELHKNRAA